MDESHRSCCMWYTAVYNTLRTAVNSTYIRRNIYVLRYNYTIILVLRSIILSENNVASCEVSTSLRGFTYSTLFRRDQPLISTHRLSLVCLVHGVCFNHVVK